MIEILSNEPDWEYYNMKSVYTLFLKKYWSQKDLSGGPLTGSLSTYYTSDIKTPMKDLIMDVKNYGYFEIKKIQHG